MTGKRKVAVTGLGVVSPLGNDHETFWKGLVEGRSGIGRISHFDPSAFRSQIAGEVRGLDTDRYIAPKEQRHLDPFCVYGLAASQMAIEDAGLAIDHIDPRRAGVVAGSGIGGLQVLQKQWGLYLNKGPSRFSPFMIPQMISNILAGHMAIRFDFRGPNFCVTSACATATHALGEALRIIQHGEADLVLAGGAEGSVCELSVGGFCAMRALSTRNEEPQKASRPFDRDRDGFVIAEGAGILLLEDWEHAIGRGAHIYCELAGYGRSCDAHHITAPQETAEESSEGMRLAMEDACIDASDVDYINAHGTSTQLNDQGETLAIKKALGEDRARRVMISSTKSMTGHLLGAAGGVETVACALILERGIVPPTINYENPDEHCDLDYVPNEAREEKVSACLTNSLGFGGHNATLCLKAR